MTVSGLCSTNLIRSAESSIMRARTLFMDIGFSDTSQKATLSRSEDLLRDFRSPERIPNREPAAGEVLRVNLAEKEFLIGCDPQKLVNQQWLAEDQSRRRDIENT